MVDVEESFVKFLKETKDVGKDVEIAPFDNIIAGGMGGSGIAADILKIFVKDKPLYVVHDYEFPKWANTKTLVLLISYLGNSEEIMSLYLEAKKRNCQIIAITSGGKLKDRCLGDKVSYVRLPSGIEPKTVLPMILVPLLNILKVNVDYENVIQAIRSPVMKEKAKEMAESMVERIPIIYSSSRMYPIAYRWKTMFNLNAKIQAFASVFPEMNHNELEAYSEAKQNFYVVMIRDEDDSLRMKQRMDLTKKIIMERKVPVTELSITGKNLFVRIISGVFLGDITSVMLAGMYEINKNSLIDDFKKQLR